MTPRSQFRSIHDCLHCDQRLVRQFCNFDGQALSDYNLLGLHREFQNGDTIFFEDGASTTVHILCTGSVKLSCTSRRGKTLILKIAMPGDVLGLGAVMSGVRYEVTAEAIEQTSVKSVARQEFMAFLDRHGKAGMHAAERLSEDYRATFLDVRRLALSASVAARLAGVLMAWGRQSVRGGATAMSFNMALTHEELGDLAGSSRETVTRLLGRFRREKLIEIKGSTMSILAPEKLDALAV